MSTVLAIIGYVFMFSFMASCLLLLVLGLPGNWLIALTAIIFALVTGFTHGIGWWDIFALLAMAGTGELIELIMTARGAQKHGGTNKEMAGAIVGGLVGAFALNTVVPILGALIGAFLGVYLGALMTSYYLEKDMEKARRVGAGALLGRMGSVLVKLSIGITMIAVVVWQIFFTAG